MDPPPFPSRPHRPSHHHHRGGGTPIVRSPWRPPQQPLHQHNPPHFIQYNNPIPPQHHSYYASRMELLGRIEQAVSKARRDLIAAGESVSAWKVSKAVFLAMKVDSWESLGFRTQDVASLQSIIAIEGKVNAFINCFVAVRKITSLHDLERAICSNEGIENFEVLELGPFLRYPLVVHYFSLSGDVTKVLKITSEEIVSYLGDFLLRCKRRRVEVEEFLDFIARKKSAEGKEKLGIRIRSLGHHITLIFEARKSEDASLRKSLKQKMDEKSGKIPCVQSDDLSSTLEENFVGRGINYGPLTSDDEDVDHSSDENNCDIDQGIKIQTSKSMICALDSGAHGTKESTVFQNLSCIHWLKEDIKERDGIVLDPTNYTRSGRLKKNIAPMKFSDLRIFMRDWKDRCRATSISEVSDSMIDKYGSSLKQKRKMGKMIRKAPFLQLANVAVVSIRSGILDDIYDSLAHERFREICTKTSDHESSDHALNEMGVPVVSKTKSVNVDDIVGKVAEYMQLNHNMMAHDLSVIQNRLFILRKLFDCEAWLTQQFSVTKFELLGHGDYFNFLEEQESLLPPEMHKFLRGNVPEKSYFNVHMQQQQLVELVAQALNGLWEGETVTEQMISALLMSQFPFLTFEIDGSIENLLKSVGLYRNNAISKCVIFSKSLMANHDVGGDLSVSNDEEFSHAEERGIHTSEKACSLESLSGNDAIEVLLRAPMLEDLNTWSHWDVLFAPTLGPLVGWLLNEVNRRDLLCLVTKDGKVIRIDHSASMTSFLQIALQGSPFQMAVQLLSLLSLLGGEKHVPCSLLKSHACHAFDVLFFTKSGNKENASDYSVFGKASHSSNTEGEYSSYEPYGDLNNASDKVSLASRFFLDCLGYLPSEFRAFAADILLSGVRNFVTQFTAVILSECKATAERILLHEVGLSLGILEWIQDYYAFCSTSVNESYRSCKALSSNNDTSELSAKSTLIDFDMCGSSILEGDKSTSFAEGQRSQNNEVCCSPSSKYFMDECLTPTSTEQNECEDASFVIECIRREEFGLDPSLSNDESSLLKKQHARLGRALHCLSQELYSQDSHFLLELVQNADDNTYPVNVEPTLSFILQESGIIILNNEQGFSAQNIRALCDVGNSTKKGNNTGYIGKKGIGFKSVFRVTDSPEIHSNGFHVKFDISEGEIGFVLPTVIAPHDVSSFNRLVSMKTDLSDANCWKTCIVLPFNSKMLEGIARGSVIAMFSDLHPSLLLFLHRLKSIRFRNMLNDSLVVMRKEDKSDGIVKVSCGEKEMNWFVASQKLDTNGTYCNVQSTEIALAFTLQELEDGSYRPILDPQPVFAFLPLRTYGLKFILQGDFVLPSSREEVDGNNPWNQWLLSEFPNLFVNAQRQFCSLPCFNNNLGKAVTAYMSYVPLVNEVNGFFSSLPRMIISRLRHSDCLILEGDNSTWVPPCRVLRNWNKQAHTLLNKQLLEDLLGLGFLNKDIILSDQLTRMLGIEDYGPKILLQILKSLCHRKNGLQSVGLSWLSACLNAIYVMYPNPSEQVPRHYESDDEILRTLHKLPFVPLSDGTFGSLDDGAIWLQSDAFNIGMDSELASNIFPNLYAKLRIVNPAFLSAKDSSDFCMDASSTENTIAMLFRVGVRRLSSHEILKVHILPTICDDRNTKEDKVLMTEFLCFLLVHLQSNCPSCHSERDHLMSELRSRAFILTNHGFKKPNLVPIHFGKKFGISRKVSKLIMEIGMNWHEVDAVYLNHAVTKSLLHGKTKWKEFLQEIGVTDFVQVVQVDKKIGDISHKQEKDLMASRSVAKDWESPELDHILTCLSTNGDSSSCKALLEILDSLWDDSFCDKAVGYYGNESGGERQCFQSSFMKSLCDVCWVVSHMDGKLYCPGNLFYDCDAVHSILGCSAPYAVPKVKSERLLHAIGFKTKVTLEDVIEILKIWRSGNAFKASIAQMSRLYTFMWKEISTSKQAQIHELLTGPFIFVPLSKDFRDEELVPGSFLSPKEVCWDNSTGFLGPMENCNQRGFVDIQHEPISKTLCNIYPGLHDFFVSTCGVCQNPSFTEYFQILLHVSSSLSPTQSANYVFRVFLKLADLLKSAKVLPEDINSIKQRLHQPDFTVLPSCHNKWVSLHPSFGLVCWSDDENLVGEFKCLDKVELLHFGEPDEGGKDMFSANMPVLMQTLAIPAFSEVVTREAIYYGLLDSTSKASLVEWALSYAQRYIYHVHPEAYAKLKLSGFSDLMQLNVVVVERLFYRSIIKNVGIASEKRFEISSLLQVNTLFVTPGSDIHALFMEVSRVFFNGTPELHLANFLHMITTMAESGSTEEQIEYFVINNQKVLKLPDDEPFWTLPSVSSLIEHEESPQASSFFAMIKLRSSLHSKKTGRSNSCWPPANQRAAPHPGGSSTTQILKQAAILDVDASSKMMKEDDSDFAGEIKSNLEANTGDVLNENINQPVSDNSVSTGSDDSTFVSDIQGMDSSHLEQRNELNIGAPDATQAVVVGRMGENVVFRHFTEKLGSASVKWVNEGGETGLPYDITIRSKGKGLRYIEVKATLSEGKDWFSISAGEWKFAADKGDSLWIAHVVLGDESRIRIFRDPVELCRLRKLQLAIVMPKEDQVQDE